MEKLFNWINLNGWIISIFMLVLGAFLHSLLDKNRELIMKIADKKAHYYSGYIDSLLNLNKTNSYEVNNRVNKEFFYFKNMIILYGSQDVIEKLAICEREGINNETENGKRIYRDLIKSMKNDISNPKIIKYTWIKKDYIIDKNIDNILFNYKKSR